ncbi:hypothetical protein QYE88_42165, partial [Enterobacter hormaechei subsp. steigerwaltii]|nr:hypothetical protein [Enterobacter hormaechei subsp. steigerwaltii]
VVVSDGKTSVQSNVQVTVNPKAAPAPVPNDEDTNPADDVTPPSDKGSCDAPVDANASKYAGDADTNQ